MFILLTSLCSMVNPVIGDESFKHFYHISPLLFSLFGLPSFEELRIKTHLLYVHQQLANKDCSSLPEEQKLRRREGLNNLEQYALDCVFPKNHDSWKRTPAFVDKEGRLCAVAHIMSRAGMTSSCHISFYSPFTLHHPAISITSSPHPTPPTLTKAGNR